MKHYRLDGKGNPVHEPDYRKWTEWFQSTNQKVADTVIGEATVSTIFLGLAYADPPQYWETAVLGGALNQTTDHCGGSREQAEAMHNRMVERVKKLYTKATT